MASYTEDDRTEIINKICNYISNDGMAVRNVLKMEGMPDSKTFYSWIDNDKDKLQQYARATTERADKIFEDILIISDSTADDIIKDKDGNEVINHRVIQRDKLRTDNRKWMLGKLNPKKYGEKLDVTTDGDKITPQSIPLVLSDGRTYEDLTNELKPE